MRRTFLAAAAAVVVLATVQEANAVCCDDTAMYVKQGYHANQMWPWPYVCPDRIAVREPFCIMVNNGWRRQNLLGAHHFNPDTNQLNAAGQLKVQWIMTQAPPDRRSIFVERSLDHKRERPADRCPSGLRDASCRRRPHSAQVAETSLMFEGRPASVVDATNVKFQQTMPAPVLPAAQSTSSTTAQ